MHLEENIAQLVEHLRVVVPVRGVGQLVCLLDRVRDDRALVLLAVPGTLLAQPPGDRVEPGERLPDLRSAGAQAAYFFVELLDEDVVVRDGAVVVDAGGAVCVCGAAVLVVFGGL